MRPVDWNDVQGLVLRGYAETPQSCYLLLHIDDAPAARAWLAELADRVTTSKPRSAPDADNARRPPGDRVNIAFTWPGLKALGLSTDALDTFPRHFREGMAAPLRSRILGDTGDSAPEHWLWGAETDAVDDIHVLLLLFGPDTGALDQAVADHLACFKPAGHIVGEPMRTRTPDDEREHFGFRDGISQPVITGTPRARRTTTLSGPNRPVKAGEFVLGYLNEHGQRALSPSVARDPNAQRLLPLTDGLADGRRDLGFNGTYLVCRQLAQDVAGFWQFVAAAARADGGANDPQAVELLAAKFVGRWRSGAPLTVTPHQDDSRRSHENDFGFHAEDRQGHRCPLGSHIRRSNPRDSLLDDPAAATQLASRHRMLRRGRLYGPRLADRFDASDRRDRGLIFICLGANIERQFEFVQQTWLNSTKFAGLYDEKDPLAGDQPPATGGVMTIPGTPVRQRVTGIPRFVTTRGGAYFFMPGISALHYLAAM